MPHELAHVLNHDILVGTIGVNFAGAISMIGNMRQTREERVLFAVAAD